MQSKPKFNSYDQLPYIPYKLVEELAKSEESDNIFKLLYYKEYDALSQPSLTFEQKMDMIWCNQDEEENYNIFLKPLVVNEIVDATTQLRIYKSDINPTDNMMSVVCYEFDFVTGAKIAMVDYNGIPCPRIDVLETEVLKSLNGKDTLGVGYFQFNTELSRLCRERLAFSNGKTFFGNSLIFGVTLSSIKEGVDCG